MHILIFSDNDLLIPFPPPAVDIDPKTKWYTLEADKGLLRMKGARHNIPICALAPTVPRRIVPKVGWNNIHEPERDIATPQHMSRLFD
jgi:hypothetical protein